MADADEIAVVSDCLRTQVRQSGLTPAEAVSALLYALVAVIAENAHDPESADSAITKTVDLMRSQVRAFGVTRRHP
jgi:hypothetical protein